MSDGLLGNLESGRFALCPESYWNYLIANGPKMSYVISDGLRASAVFQS